MSVQRDRVLRALQAAGPRGVTGYDLSGPVVVDGGERIMRVAARVCELRAQGHRITKAPVRRDGHDIYVLDVLDVGVAGGPGTASPPPAVPPHGETTAVAASDPSATLFDMPKRPAGAYDRERAA